MRKKIFVVAIRYLGKRGSTAAKMYYWSTRNRCPKISLKCFFGVFEQCEQKRKKKAGNGWVQNFHTYVIIFFHTLILEISQTII